MALELILLAGGSFLVTSAIAYAWWADARVTFLREEMFCERDRLWDIAYELDGLNDPAYQAARKHLNAIVATAGTLSARTLRLFESLPDRPIERCQSQNPQLQAAIDDTRDRSIRHIMRYIVFYSVSGWLLLAQSIVRYGPTRARNEAASLVNSRLPEQVLEADRASHRCPVAALPPVCEVR